MFEIFKKNRVKSLDNKNNYPKEVIEIHNEFEIASEKLLEEANNIINSLPTVNESKINILKSLGFRQVKEVQESSQVSKKANLSQVQINLVNYYNNNYPFNKFINEEQVRTICHKYNLVFGDVDRFRGFVPEKNLKEISNFKIKSKDDISLKIGEYYIILNDFSLIKFDDIEKNGYILYRNDISWYKRYLSTNDYSYSGSSASTPKTNIPGWGKTFQYRLDNLSDRDIKKAVEINNSTLKICAPVKDMDISGLELIEGYKLEVKRDIPDPVVLKPVRGGYLILTAWGDEASDPLVVNQNFN